MVKRTRKRSRILWWFNVAEFCTILVFIRLASVIITLILHREAYTKNSVNKSSLGKKETPSLPVKDCYLVYSSQADLHSIWSAANIHIICKCVICMSPHWSCLIKNSKCGASNCVGKVLVKHRGEPHDLGWRVLLAVFTTGDHSWALQGQPVKYQMRVKHWLVKETPAEPLNSQTVCVF